MIWANIQQLAAMGIQNSLLKNPWEQKHKNSFDKDYVSILMLMLRWLPSYMNDLRNRAYNPPPRAEASLRNIFAQAASKNYFFESIPSVANPLGLSERSVPLAEKIQDILIHDFLSYLALNHNIYPETWDENEKKTSFTSFRRRIDRRSFERP